MSEVIASLRARNRPACGSSDLLVNLLRSPSRLRQKKDLMNLEQKVEYGALLDEER